MNLSASQIQQLALECGFEEFIDCEVVEENKLMELDNVFMGDVASLMQFAEQLYQLFKETP